jgi:hypothetical protein
MTWKFQPAPKNFEQARKGWDALNRSCGNHILLDSGFVGQLLDHFGNDRVLLGINSDAAGPGMGLFINKGGGRWETFQPSQAPLGLILFENSGNAGSGLSHIMRRLPGHALQCSILQQDPDYSCITLNPNGVHLERLDYIQTARVTLSGTFDDYWKARGTNLRHNLARRRRRMHEKGYSLELNEIRTPGEVGAAVRDYGLLESKGWKGHQGTAIAPDNEQGRFYRAVLEDFCSRGEAVIYQLRLNDRLAATDFCLIRDGMMVVLKTTYDEELNDFSPAFLMREEILKSLFGKAGMRVVEFYGRVMEWHTKWSEEIRTLYHINCFRYHWVVSLRNFSRRFS